MPNPSYPTLPISFAESKRIVRDGREEDTAGDGASRVRKLHADKSDFEIKHPGLTAAELSTLQTFYNTYGENAAIDFVWPEDGVTYVVRFGKGAMAKEFANTLRRHVLVRLVGV